MGGGGEREFPPAQQEMSSAVAVALPEVAGVRRALIDPADGRVLSLAASNLSFS